MLKWHFVSHSSVGQHLGGPGGIFWKGPYKAEIQQGCQPARYIFILRPYEVIHNLVQVVVRILF